MSNIVKAEPTISMGPGTHAIPVSLFRDNRLRVCDALKALPSQVIDDNTFVLLQGGDAINWYNTDCEYAFKQVNPNFVIMCVLFHYLL